MRRNPSRWIIAAAIAASFTTACATAYAEQSNGSTSAAATSNSGVAATQPQERASPVPNGGVVVDLNRRFDCTLAVTGTTNGRPQVRSVTVPQSQPQSR
jgi:hypothetical protein